MTKFLTIPAILITGAAAFLSGCGSSGNGDKGAPPEPLTVATPPAKNHADLSWDRGSAKVVMDFLLWYKSNYETLNGIQLVKYMDENDQPPKVYELDQKNVDKYLEYFRVSGHVSEGFIREYRLRFDQAAAAFKKDKINEGPPPYLDFDWVLNSQDTDGDLEKMSQSKLVDVNDSGAESTVQMETPMGMPMVFKLEEQGGAWKIAGITYP